LRRYRGGDCGLWPRYDGLPAIHQDFRHQPVNIAPLHRWRRLYEARFELCGNRLRLGFGKGAAERRSLGVEQAEQADSLFAPAFETVQGFSKENGVPMGHELTTAVLPLFLATLPEALWR
jgi:hypothetical protein